MRIQNYYSGTSGLVTPIPTKLYPPEFQGKGRLSYYASLYDSIEINSSFYKLPQQKTVDKWSTTVPEKFQFSFKVSKVITHVKKLEFQTSDVVDFMKVIGSLNKNIGCLLIQFPPGLHGEHIEQLEILLENLKAEDPDNNWKLAVEFRHQSWYNGNTYRLLDYFKAATVIHDIPASKTPTRNIDSDFVYIRFHGPDGTYRGNYSDQTLNSYADYIKELLMLHKQVYVYFNNTMGNALENLNTLNALITQKN